MPTKSRRSQDFPSVANFSTNIPLAAINVPRTIRCNDDCRSNPLILPIAESLTYIKASIDNKMHYIQQCEHGLGIFAARYIAEGRPILMFAGNTIDFDETKKKGTRECMPLQIGIDHYIDITAPGVYLNHSCDPNAGVIHDRYLVAIRDIQANEHICFDYSTTMHEYSFTMQCLCGSPNCRRVVRDFVTLPILLQQYYFQKSCVMSFITRVFDSTGYSGPSNRVSPKDQNVLR